jgi:hypothetical protein
VTDHGTKDPEEKGDSRITLWGNNENIAMSELRSLLARLDPGVRVLALMSQCFSSGFADLMSAHLTGELPAGNVCGYFSSTADRFAYGCYPENRGRENIGHSFDFLQALRREPRFPDARAAVLVADQTPDVPLTTGDVYLANLLRRAAEAAGEGTTAYIDTLLRQAWRDKAAWEPQIRLLGHLRHPVRLWPVVPDQQLGRGRPGHPHLLLPSLGPSTRTDAATVSRCTSSPQRRAIAGPSRRSPRWRALGRQAFTCLLIAARGSAKTWPRTRTNPSAGAADGDLAQQAKAQAMRWSGSVRFGTGTRVRTVASAEFTDGSGSDVDTESNTVGGAGFRAFGTRHHS